MKRELIDIYSSLTQDLFWRFISHIKIETIRRVDDIATLGCTNAIISFKKPRMNIYVIKYTNIHLVSSYVS